MTSPLALVRRLGRHYSGLMAHPDFRITYESSRHKEFSFHAHSAVLKDASAVFRDRFESGEWVSLFLSDGYNDFILTL